MSGFDIYPWILSEEIREHIRRTHTLSIFEKEGIICRAYRSLEEKLSALQALSGEAKNEKEHEKIGQRVLLYQFALRQLHTSRPGQVFLLVEPVLADIEDWYPALNKSIYKYSDIYMFPSYEKLMRGAPDLIGQKECLIEKRSLAEEEPEGLQYDMKEICGNLCVTNFYIGYKEYKMLEPYGNIQKEPFDNQIFYKNNQETDFPDRHPYTLPFSTGDLVKLDAPMYGETVFGVMLNTKDFFNCPYIWMGCFNGCCFWELDLSMHMIDVYSDYCVIDWLHSVSKSEFLKGQEVLVNIGKELHEIAKKDSRAAEDMFHEIFGEAIRELTKKHNRKKKECIPWLKKVK